MNRNEYVAGDSNYYRKIVVNGIQPMKYATNAISTTKYSLLSFVPLFLYEQFHNYTNCFFLLVSIIQQFPEASSLGRFTTLIPLCVILLVSAIKEILEDANRYRGDKRVNRKVVLVLKDYRWVPVDWRHVQVGDLVKVLNDDFFPADLLLLKSSDGGSGSGLCYIETVNLDGENNLKIRRIVPGLNSESVSSLSGIVECDPPNEKIYSFSGVYRIGDGGGGSSDVNVVNVPLTADHILLRGAILRNTEWIVGLAVYTGGETKIMKNSSNTRLKRSSVSIMVNSHIVALFIIFLAFTLVHWILFMVWNNDHYDREWYIPLDVQRLTDASSIIICLVFGVIYAILIPISLQVMQELSRFIQGVFIANDVEMYYESMDIPAMVKTSSLNEDLALVKYVFADKTGTLTKNVLEFKCCSIAGTVYHADNLRTLSHSTSATSTSTSGDCAISNFFLAICLCPGVIPVSTNKVSGGGKSGGGGGGGDDDREDDNDDIFYYASSPDHKALILAARDFDYVLTGRSHSTVDVRTKGRPQRFEVLCDFEFSSDRRRTSVIVRDANKKLFLYVLGADDVILSQCVPQKEPQQRRKQHQQHGSDGSSSSSIEEITRQHVENFASKGLRSLCVAMREIEQKDFDAWYPHYRRASESLDAKDELKGEAESLMVKELTLLGCTAVEDKLQDDVPQTIESLMEAGINMWILTGDKQETALNIGYACRLLSNELPLIVLNSTDVQKMRPVIANYRRVLGDRFARPGNNYGLLVTGDCLNALLESKVDCDNFVRLMLSCRAVICCRTTPKQKAQVVKTVQKYTHFVTLAIGDGANDVAMIQTASIGVGISGMEGLQAANAADYAIGQFKYLKRLLLVHGTWSYNRICKMIYFIYYKNVAIATIQLYYTATNGWSGQLFLDRWAKMLYNVLLTSAPTLAFGIFEQNLPAQVLMKNPYVYTKNKWFHMRSFYLCLFNGVAHSVLLSWLTLGIFESGVHWSSGLNDHYMVVGNAVYTGLITIICLKCGLHTYHWTNVTVLFMVLSEMSWLIVLAALSHTWPWIYAGEDMPCMVEMLFSTPVFWLYMVFIVVAILLLDALTVILYRVFREPVINSLRNSSVRESKRLHVLT